MNEWVKLALEVFMVFSSLAVLMCFVCRLTWTFYYYVLACKNPLGKTVLTSFVALYLICAGFYAII